MDSAKSIVDNVKGPATAFTTETGRLRIERYA